ncbi:MAG: hypothetical protein ACOX6O_12005 [Christensenellales bacterium]|jgi:hypothetical protein
MRRGSEVSPLALFIPLLLIGGFIRQKSKKAGAIYDIIWSGGVLLWGVSVMQDGGSIALFGSIELPPMAFIGIMALVIFSEIASLIKISRQAPLEAEAEKKRVEEQQQEVIRIESAAEKLATPGELYIVHRQGIIGSANKIQLTLNGRELPALGNGEIVRTKLTLADNRLTSVCSGVLQKEIKFNAPPSGAMRIDVVLKAGKGILLEENPNVHYREIPPGKKRVRPVNVGMALWSITNFWCYLLGIVPLRKTLRASKHPFDDIAQLRLNSAKKWNLWMTGILIVATLTFILPRLR